MRFVLKLGVVLLMALLGWLAWALLLPLTPERETFVLLPAGFSSRQIALRLENNRVIRSSSGFLLFHYLQRSRTLKAGEYRFQASGNAIQVLNRLARGDIYTHTVVIPEGYNIFDVAQAIQQAGLGPAEAFLEVARTDLAQVRGFDPQATSLEGYLFPDTYEFTRTQSMHDMAQAMVRRFEQAARQVGLSTAASASSISAEATPARNAGLSADDSRALAGVCVAGPANLHAIVTLASIVEKETANEKERSLVAGVYCNRLQRGMALGADPTIVYAALLNRRYRGAIYQSDLLFDSPYNTYKHSGLPPGPIANPGAASLRAAMNPERTNYLYFVADGQGGHRFTSSYEEHSRNVAAYRRAQRPNVSR
jgi:UPF0755 protein